MKKTYLLIAGIVAIALGISYLAFAATDCGTAWPTSYDNYSAGCIIHSALFNNIEQSIGLNPTSTPLTNKVGNISGVVNTSTISLNVSGTGLSEATTSNSITITLASSSYLQPSNNLSDVASAATARTNLGLGDAATLSSSTWLKVSNNLSDLNNTATARTNLGLGSSATHPSSDYLSSSTSYVSSINGATGTYYLLGGNDVTIATSSTSSVISVNTSAAAAGSSTDVQYNDNGTFGATSTFTYNSSTGQLALTASPASLVVGSSSQFSATTTLTLLYSETGASTSFQIPPGVNSITINAQGAGSGGEGGSVTGTLAVIPGTTYYIDVGGSNGYNGGGSAGGGAASPGGGMTWFSASSTFSTSTVILVAGGGGGTGVSAGALSAGGGGGGYFGGGGGSVNGTNGTNGSAGQGGNGSFNGGFAGGPSPGVGGFGGGLTAGSGTGGSPGLGGSQTAGGGITGGTGAGSGGGGSSYLSPSLSATSSATGTVSGNGSLSITFVPPYGLKVDGHIITGGASPTLSNGTVAGTDETGHVTVSSSTSAYTLVFGSPWDNAPACTAAMSSGTAAYFQNIASVSTSTVFTANTSLATSSIFQYLCLGY